MRKMITLNLFEHKRLEICPKDTTRCPSEIKFTNFESMPKLICFSLSSIINPLVYSYKVGDRLRDNVRNQREHLVLHIANAQMRLQTPPDHIDSLNPFFLRRFRRGFLSNYSSWCSYLDQKSKIWLPEPNPHSADLRRELLYVALYFLI
ncbi:hypothetical protein Scep_011975 [Stephania cephalantha]|uniref:Uncharacterized protein n=1 Tax=Stephania cephalantha TaxID=152367 RepID=A0AAP0JEB9_9MAGN